jgi:hypothetical protein
LYTSTSTGVLQVPPPSPPIQGQNFIQPQPTEELTVYAWLYPELANTNAEFKLSTFPNNPFAFYPAPGKIVGGALFEEPTFFPNDFHNYDVLQYHPLPSFNTDITYNTHNVAMPAYPHHFSPGAGPMMPQAPISLAPAAPPVTTEEVLHHCTKGCEATSVAQATSGVT